MATATITITSATNPTYGGCIDFDGTSTYVRTVLSGGNPTVNFATPNIKRTFAFFDLSTDPTGGGTITKVELLATVNSVSGTHAVDVGAFDSNDVSSTPSDPAGDDDASVYLNAAAFDVVTNQATAAGALAIDLSTGGITTAQSAITNGTFACLGVSLSNEAAAGSVVFDAATGFGLRITYTPVATGFQAMLLTGAGA